MKIKKIDITQFRGISNVIFDNFKEVNTFVGKNGIGKSTIIDCIMWMIADETFAYGLQNEDNKNKHNTKDVIEVELTIEDNENVEYVLKRTYFEKWKENEFQKMENKFEINGAKYSATEYFEKIKSIIGITNIKTKKINILRLLMDTSYLESIDYKIAREFIEEILGVVSDTDLANDPKYEIIRNGLLQQQTKEGKFDLVKTKSQFKKTLDTATAQIETLNKGIKENKSRLNENALEELQKIESEKTAILTSKVEDDENYIKIKSDIDNLKNKIVEEEGNLKEEINKSDAEINRLIVLGNKIKNDMALVEKENQLLDEKLNESKNYCNKLEEELKEVNDSTFVEKVCPNCGQVLNANEKTEFENDKEKRLLGIKESLETNKKNIEQVKGYKTKNENKIKSLKKEFNETGTNYSQEFKRNQELKAQFDSNEKIKDINNKIDKLDQKLIEVKNVFENTKNEKINALILKASELGASIQLKNAIEQAESQLVDLKKEKALAEMQIQTLDDFKKYKLKLTRENTNKVFPNVEFEMLYESPTTGVLTECCYPKYKDIEFNGLNSGNKYPLGVEVIEDVKRALNITEDLPILIDRKADLDNANLNKLCSLTNAQIFTTFVSNDNIIKLLSNDKGDKE